MLRRSSMECVACHHPNDDGARFCRKCGAPLPQQEEKDPLIGTLVGGRFQITGILGEGGMGRVYTAEQQMGTKKRKVAVKTIVAEYAKDPQVVARFMREGGVVFGLDHEIPNGTPLENYRYYVDLGREILGLPPRSPERRGWARMGM